MAPAPHAAIGFALEELAACWNQGYEALAQGDLPRVQALLDVADDHLPIAGNGEADTPDLAQLRTRALEARGRLEHGMRAGLVAMAEELAKTRLGAKVLKGYADPIRSPSRLRADA